MTYHYIPHGLSVGDAQIPPVDAAPETFKVYNRVGIAVEEGDVLMLDLYGTATETTVFEKYNPDGTSAWGSVVAPTLVNLQRSLPIVRVVEGGADNAVITVARAAGYVTQVKVGTSLFGTTASAVAGDSVYMRNAKTYLDIDDTSTCLEVGVLLESVGAFAANNETQLASVMLLYPSYQRTV